VSDVYNLIYEAAGNMLLKMDPAETKRVVQIQNALYDKVYSYSVPSDLKGDAFVDIRPQYGRLVSDNFNNTTPKEFDLYKTDRTFAVENNSGVKTVKISAAQTLGLTIHEMNSLTLDGTWVVGGNATAIAVDTLNFLTGNGSIQFNINAGATSSWIENLTMSVKDLSNYVTNGAYFLYVYIPNITIITAVSLRIGASSSNYLSQTVTNRSDATGFQVGWNLVRFDAASMVATGTPNVPATDYVRVTFTTTTAAVTGVRVENIVARFGKIYEAVYYSKYLFKSSAGIWQEKPLADEDFINLDTDSFNILMAECSLILAQQIQGEDSRYDVDFWENFLANAYKQYAGTNKSERLKKRTTYYRMR